MKIVAVAVVSLMLLGCGPRIDKVDSLTVKLRDGFSVQHGPCEPSGSFDRRPITFAYGEWTYTPKDKPQARNATEQLKDEVDRIGESIIGQIFVSLAEVVIKGTIELGASGIQTALEQDEVVVTLGNEVGTVSLIAEEGFNRVALTASELAVLREPWTLEVWSMRRYRYALAVTGIPSELFASRRFIEIELTRDGTVRVNGRAFNVPTPAKR